MVARRRQQNLVAVSRRLHRELQPGRTACPPTAGMELPPPPVNAAAVEDAFAAAGRKSTGTGRSAGGGTAVAVGGGSTSGLGLLAVVGSTEHAGGRRNAGEGNKSQMCVCVWAGMP